MPLSCLNCFFSPKRLPEPAANIIADTFKEPIPKQLSLHLHSSKTCSHSFLLQDMLFLLVFSPQKHLPS